MVQKWAVWLHNPYHLGGGGVTNASERRRKAEMAHIRVVWLQNHCCMGGPQCFRAGEKINNGPQMDRLAKKHLPLGSPRCATMGDKIRATNGRFGYTNTTTLGGPQCFRVGDKISGGPFRMGSLATQPLPSWGVPGALERRRKLEVAHEWAVGLHNPCRLGGSPTVMSKGENQQWPTSRLIGHPRGKFFIAVKSCNFFVVNACTKKVMLCNFFYSKHEYGLLAMTAKKYRV